MQRATAVLGAALVVFATAVSAQDKPNFNGTWTLDAEKSAAANPMGGGGGGGGGRGTGGGGMGMGMGMGPLTIKVDGNSFSTEREGRNGPMVVVYKLDGSEQSIQMGPANATAKAKWDGNTIVIETTREFNGNTMTSKTVYAIEGSELVVSMTNPGRGGEPMTRKQIYRKT